MPVPFMEALARLLWALMLGAIVGVEREVTQKSAGLRTHMLVCMGSAIYTLISVSDFLTGPSGGIFGLSHQALHDLPRGVSVTFSHDPGRIAAQIVTGIGFIGGGALLRYGNSVRGVTTAASLWMIASIGMLAGVGQYSLSLATSIIAVLVLFTLGRAERVWFNKTTRHHDRVCLSLTVKAAQLKELRNWLEPRLRKDMLESQVLPSDEGISHAKLVYTLNIQGKPFDWPNWRERLESKDGVSAVGVRFFQAEHPEDGMVSKAHALK